MTTKTYSTAKNLYGLFRFLVETFEGRSARLARIDELYITKAAVERCVIHDLYDRNWTTLDDFATSSAELRMVSLGE